jgi:5-methylcytosine-specific restriction endonuclease McrA
MAHSREAVATVRVVAAQVLLLNASHEPLAVVTWRRAIVLILAGKAISLEDRAESVHSAQRAVAMPSVVRLTRYVRIPYRTPSTVSRNGVLRRDSRTCAYCGGRADTIDHVVPRSRGGAHSWENCVACCHRCNSRKADHTLDELGWELRGTPVVPVRVAGGELAVDECDPAWRRWLDATAA